MANFNEFRLWRKAKIQEYLRDRGLPTTGNKDELVAMAFGASYFSVPLKASAKEETRQKAEQYRKRLTVEGVVLPDPLSDLNNDWVGEGKGMSLWPPCMYCDLAEYLVDNSERDLRTRLLTDYKEGKAFSYFDSKWLKEVFYHNISSDSAYCFLKAECTPSMNIHHHPHQAWVCIKKNTGKIISGYCTCFAGYVHIYLLHNSLFFNKC